MSLSNRQFTKVVQSNLHELHVSTKQLQMNVKNQTCGVATTQIGDFL